MTVVPNPNPRPQSHTAHSTKRKCIQCLKIHSKQSFFRRKHNEPPRLFAACNTCALDRWNQAGRWKARLAKQLGVNKDELIWWKVLKAVDVKLPSTVEECEAVEGWRGEGDVFEEGEGGRDDGDGGKENDGNISADELEALFVASFEDEAEIEPEVADGNEVGLTRAYSPPPSPSFSLTRSLASDIPPTPSLPKPTLSNLLEDLGQIAKRERDGAVQGMKEMCAETGMEGWEEQLETELVGMEMGVWRVCEGRGCLGLTWKEVGKGKFPELCKMHGQMEWRDRL
jgi:hypothetical protein